MGMVLTQCSPVNQRFHPCVVFLSTPHASRIKFFDVENRELLALVFALQEWRHWLVGTKEAFVVYLHWSWEFGLHPFCEMTKFTLSLVGSSILKVQFHTCIPKGIKEYHSRWAPTFLWHEWWQDRPWQHPARSLYFGGAYVGDWAEGRGGSRGDHNSYYSLYIFVSCLDLWFVNFLAFPFTSTS